MAAGKTLEKLRQLYVKVDADVKLWVTLQEEGMSLLGTIANIAARLPALQDDSCYGTLAALPSLPARLLAKQLVALDALLVELQQCVDQLQATADDMARQAQQAQRFVQQDRSLTPAVRRAAAGPVPSVDQCLEGLAEISRMHAEEMRVKRAILQELRYDTPESDVRQAAALMAAQPHIDAGRVRDLLHLVAATQEKPRF